MACYALLYVLPASWGWSSGRRLGLTSAATFGAQGAEWITGVGVALGAIVAFAVALHMGLRLVFLGLISCGLLDPATLQPLSLAPIRLESPVFLLTAVFWIFITSLTAILKIPSVIFALMQVYTPLALLLLGVTALLTSDGLPMFLQARGSLAEADPGPAWLGCHTEVFQLIFGAFAFSALFAVEWGMVVRQRRDLRIGGWVGILLAGWFATLMMILTVAGAIGKVRAGGAAALSHPREVLISPWSFHWAIVHGIGGLTGGVLLMLFGLAALAPACYAAWVFSSRLRIRFPRIPRYGSTSLGSLPALVLIATSWAGELETIFGLMGAVFAPVVGVHCAEALRQRGQWQGIREGWNPPGLVAWVGGMTAGLLLQNRFEPAALFAYVVAASVYLVLTTLVPNRPMVPVAHEESALAGRALPIPDEAAAWSTGH
jgi:hypothetical protein